MSPERVVRKEPEGRASFQIGAATEQKNRFRNEDQHFTLPEFMAAGVFDGVGGNQGGQDAAIMARDMVRDGIKNLARYATYSHHDATTLVRTSLDRASREIYADPEYGGVRKGKYGMGTTASVAVICPATELSEESTDKVVIGNVGDSRVYIFRGNTMEIEQATLDDGLVRSDEWSPREQKDMQAKAGRAYIPAEVHPRFGSRTTLLQALGDEKIDVHSHRIPFSLEGGDRVVTGTPYTKTSF